MFSLRKFLVVLLSLGAFVAFAACSGSDGSDGKNGTNGIDGIDGADGKDGKDGNYGSTSNFSCYQCHAEYAYKMADPTPITSKILGVTAKDDAARDSFRGGVHFYSQRRLNSSATEDTGCGTCHGRDYVNNRLMNSMFSFITDNSLASDSYANGRYDTYTSRVGVASCVGCHGLDLDGGHYANATVQAMSKAGTTIANDNVTNTFASCAYCHDATAGAGGREGNNSHNPPHGDRYFTMNAGMAMNAGLHGDPKWNNGARSDEEGNLSQNYAHCGFCHTYEGARKYNPRTGIPNEEAISAKIDADYDNGTRIAATGIGCGTCHDAHTGELASKPKYDTANNVMFSAEFQLCTSCHAAKIVAESNGNGDYVYYLDKSLYGSTGDADADIARIKSEAAHHYFSGSSAATSGSAYTGLNGAFVTSHFAAKSGDAIVVGFDSAAGGATVTTADNTVLKGLGINLAADSSCTGCHDPHQTSKFGAIEGKIDADNIKNITSTFAASGHGDYTASGWEHAAKAYGGGWNKDCMPCHSGRESVKYMINASNAFGSSPYTGMQILAGTPPTQTACGTCHDLDNTTKVGNTNILNGKVRVNTNNSDNFTLPAGTFTYGRTDPLPLAVTTKAVANNTIVCYSCHTGRSNVIWGAAQYSKTNQKTYTDNGTAGVVVQGANTTFVTPHYALAAGVLAGISLPDVADARDNTTATTLAPMAVKAHGAATCISCHDLNKNSHTFAVYKDNTGKAVFIGDNITLAEQYAFTTDNLIQPCAGCHGSTAISAANYLKALNFLNVATKSDWNGKAFYALPSYPYTLSVWNDNGSGVEAWNPDNTTNSVGYWTGDEGKARYAVFMTYNVLHGDAGAYAHTGLADASNTLVKTVLLESLKTIYNGSTTYVKDAASFRTWLAGFTDIKGDTVTGMDAPSIAWLCGTGSGCNGY